MSGIYISGMEMPTNCDFCTFDNGVNCMVYPPSEDMVYDISDGIPDWCPLIPVPEHGRLIDADALTDALESTDWYHQGANKNMVHGANSAEHQAWYKEQDVYAAVANTPTIIPANKEGEG